MNAYIASFMLLVAIGFALPASAAVAEEQIASNADSDEAENTSTLRSDIFDDVFETWRQSIAFGSTFFNSQHLFAEEEVGSLGKYYPLVAGRANEFSVADSGGVEQNDEQAFILVQNLVPQPIAADKQDDMKPAWTYLPARWKLADNRHVEGAP